MISLEHKYLDILAKDLADSIDTKMLYTARGWTIVKISHPWYIPHLLNNTVKDWVETHCGEHHLWDGQIAFKEARDATLFLLKWS
jgi:hypothetical protein